MIWNAFREIAPQSLKTWYYRKFKKKRSPFVTEIDDRRAIFIHVPKVAGTSIKAALYGGAKLGHVPIREYFRHDPEKTKEYFKFCFVRDPLDRFVSAYSYLTTSSRASGADRHFAGRHVAPHGSFEAFALALEDPAVSGPVMLYPHFRPQSWFACLEGEAGHAMDFVGRYERLEADMAIVSDRLGLPRDPLALHRASTRPETADAYSARSRRIVADLYRRDFDLFGYDA